MDFSKFFFAFPVDQANQLFNQHVSARGRGNRGGIASRRRRAYHRSVSQSNRNRSRYSRRRGYSGPNESSHQPDDGRESLEYTETQRQRQDYGEKDRHSKEKSEHSEKGKRRKTSQSEADKTSTSNAEKTSTKSDEAFTNDQKRCSSPTQPSSHENQKKQSSPVTSTPSRPNEGKKAIILKDGTISNVDADKIIPVMKVSGSVNKQLNHQKIISTVPNFKVSNLNFAKRDLAYMVDDSDLPLRSNSTSNVSFQPEPGTGNAKRYGFGTLIEPCDDVTLVAEKQAKEARKEFEANYIKKKAVETSKMQRFTNRTKQVQSIYKVLPVPPNRQQTTHNVTQTNLSADTGRDSAACISEEPKE